MELLVKWCAYTLHFLNYFDGLHHVLEIGFYLPANGRHPHTGRDDLSMPTASPDPRLGWCVSKSQHLRADLGPHSGCQPVSDQR